LIFPFLPTFLNILPSALHPPSLRPSLPSLTSRFGKRSLAKNSVGKKKEINQGRKEGRQRRKEGRKATKGTKEGGNKDTHITHTSVCVCVYIYIYIYICMYLYVYALLYIQYVCVNTMHACNIILIGWCLFDIDYLHIADHTVKTILLTVETSYSGAVTQNGNA
jgi:hypothetical protein